MASLSPGAPHLDGVTEHVLVVEQPRPRVGLSTAIAGAVAEAAATGRELVLITPPWTRLTFALELALSGAGTRWVVRTGDQFHDGFTGLGVRWERTRFVDDEPDVTGIPESRRTVAAVLSEDVPPAWWHLPPIDLAGTTPGTLRVTATTLHPATDALELGAGFGALAEGLTGPPRGWGVAEPVTQPWSPRELTRHLRGRMPRASVTVLGGSVSDPILGLLAVQRVDTGVREELTVAVGARRAPPEGFLELLVRQVAATGVRVMAVFWQPGPGGVYRGGGGLPAAVPLGVYLTDPDGLAAGGSLALGAGIVPMPAGHGQGGWLPFGGPDPFGQLAEVLLVGGRGSG